MTRVGVVGLGYWGPKLARNFHELPDTQLAVCCDLDDSRLAHVAELYPEARCQKDFSAVLDSDVEAVCIATPPRTHHRLATQALRAGKHVLVEKPMALCAAEADELVATAEECDRVLMVGHTFVYNPAVAAVKEIVSRGDLGEIYYVNGSRVNLGLFQRDINVAWDLAPHDISILMYVLGMAPVSASARGAAYVQREDNVHDVVYLTLYFPSGVLADVRVSWLDPRKERLYTIVGSKRMLVYDDVATDAKVMIYDKGAEVPPHSDTEAEFRVSYRWGDGVPYPVEWEEPLKAECRHFVDCIRSGAEPRSSGRVGAQVVRVLEAAQASLVNGGGREVVRW
ncbi:MAG: Gfo/Idh/MocA family oxidoreductase [Anaerolineae bacterium]|nr:Gfo/Idh/MocA family oxidoreductase [Anaerolineae bacterium]